MRRIPRLPYAISSNPSLLLPRRLFPPLNPPKPITTTAFLRVQWNPLSSKSPNPPPNNPNTSLHGTELPPRPPPPPTLRKYIFSTDYLLRGLYRSLLIAVVVVPILILWEGPIKTNHIDGEYEAFDLIERTEVAKGHSYLILRRKKPEKYWWAWYETETPDPVSLAHRSPIMSLKIKNPSLQIQRSYTPLTLSPNEIHLLVKRYPEGELSRFLHILTPGLATVWVNQGRQEWSYEEGEWDHVVFVAGGTGITPAFQLCLTALQTQKYRGQVDPGVKKTRFSVLAAARDAGSMLLRDDFEAMRRNYGDGYLDVRYFLDVPKGGKLPEDIHTGPITEKILQETVRSRSSGGWFNRLSTSKAGEKKDEKVMVLVCGPDGFTRYISGDHSGVASKQGPKGGLLEKIEGIEVFKMLDSRDDDINPPKQRRGMPVMKVE